MDLCQQDTHIHAKEERKIPQKLLGVSMYLSGGRAWSNQIVAIRELAAYGQVNHKLGRWAHGHDPVHPHGPQDVPGD